MFGWTEQILQLATLRRQFVPLPKLVVPMLGDMISGDIHDELAITNVGNNLDQMIYGAHVIAQSLIRLAANFEEVFVPCVVGNHGRMTKKPPMK